MARLRVKLAGMLTPVIFVVVDENHILDALVRDLERRFGRDYEVRAQDSPTSACDEFEALAASQREVALVIAAESMTEMNGIDVLGRARALLPSARRVLVIQRDYTSANPIVQAMALGLVDHHLSMPWDPLERGLYPAVSEFLAGWSRRLDAEHPVLRIVGETGSPDSHETRDRLTRVGVPFAFLPHDSEEGRGLLSEVGENGSRLPVVSFFDGRTFVRPSFAELVQALGGATSPASSQCDVVIVGAGPAGLAAAVYAASEGLSTQVIEPEVFGGQAGTSSLIRNYMGFNHGISGERLAYRAFEQAWLFGTDFVFTQEATALEADGRDRLVSLSGGTRLQARAVVLALGVTWRRLHVPSLENLQGSGVFYGAARSEARSMQGLDAFIVGAGNSAGQAAINLAEFAASVTIVARGASLSASMSNYLIHAIQQDPAIHVRCHTEVIDGSGDGALESLTLRDNKLGTIDEVPAAALFVLIGAEPHTDWLVPPVQRDKRGFVLTGREVDSSDAAEFPWLLDRPPLHLETSVPGVFAAGDVRHGSVKRVASAVGEGATAVQLIHEYFAEVAAIS